MTAHRPPICGSAARPGKTLCAPQLFVSKTGIGFADVMQGREEGETGNSQGSQQCCWAWKHATHGRHVKRVTAQRVIRAVRDSLAPQHPQVHGYPPSLMNLRRQQQLSQPVGQQ